MLIEGFDYSNQRAKLCTKVTQNLEINLQVTKIFPEVLKFVGSCYNLVTEGESRLARLLSQGKGIEFN